jgi:hypothetical protein
MFLQIIGNGDQGVFFFKKPGYFFKTPLEHIFIFSKQGIVLKYSF